MTGSRCRTASRLANDVVVPVDGPHPSRELEPSPKGRATFLLTRHAYCVPVAPARKGCPRSTAASEDRPRAGRLADDLAPHAVRTRLPSPWYRPVSA